MYRNFNYYSYFGPGNFNWYYFLFALRYSGILSAYGIALADVSCEKQESSAFVYDEGKLEVCKENQLTLSFSWNP